MKIALCLAFLAWLLTGCNCTPRCSTIKVVAEVGGCDRYGSCAVRYEDGTTETYVKQPVRGQKRTFYYDCPSKETK